MVVIVPIYVSVLKAIFILQALMQSNVIVRDFTLTSNITREERTTTTCTPMPVKDQQHVHRIESKHHVQQTLGPQHIQHIAPSQQPQPIILHQTESLTIEHAHYNLNLTLDIPLLGPIRIHS